MAGCLGSCPCAKCCALVGDRRHAAGSMMADCWALFLAYGCASDGQPMAGQWPHAQKLRDVGRKFVALYAAQNATACGHASHAILAAAAVRRCLRHRCDG
ncbi:hypothetical protein F511_45970 [Dorcoceras hygrometricum]|uniref:Uncharacterized protein n=1 Tax=Dorcoceras hygrometricum TaxID=472368 RepID=A0A2Z6ZUN7_9LAMI|nr:hypothetical protein F511_45970 [Dorcoceras hygrometricum]